MRDRLGEHQSHKHQAQCHHLIMQRTARRRLGALLRAALNPVNAIILRIAGRHLGYLAPLLLQFAVMHPGIGLDIEVSSRNADLVEEGFELAIRAAPLALSSLISRKLVAFPLVTLASPALFSKIGPLTHPSQFDATQCLGLGRRAWAFRHGAQVHVLTPLGRIHSNSGSTLIHAAVNAMGLVQLPGYYGRAEVAQGTLIALLTEWTPQDPFGFHIVYPPKRRLAKRIRHLIDFLVAQMPTEPNGSAGR